MLDGAETSCVGDGAWNSQRWRRQDRRCRRVSSC